MTSDRIPCTKCGSMILSATAQRTGGICMPCFKGKPPENHLPNAEMATPYGRMRERIAGDRGLVRSTNTFEERERFEKNCASFVESLGEDDALLAAEVVTKEFGKHLEDMKDVPQFAGYRTPEWLYLIALMGDRVEFDPSLLIQFLGTDLMDQESRSRLCEALAKHPRKLPPHIPLLKTLLEQELRQYKSGYQLGQALDRAGSGAAATALLSKPGSYVLLLGLCGAAAIDALEPTRRWFALLASSASGRSFTGALQTALCAVEQISGREKGNFGLSHLLWKLTGGVRKRREQAMPMAN